MEELWHLLWSNIHYLNFIETRWISNLCGIISKWNASISVSSDPVLREQMMSISQILRYFIIQHCIHVLNNKKLFFIHLILHFILSLWPTLFPIFWHENSTAAEHDRFPNGNIFQCSFDRLFKILQMSFINSIIFRQRSLIH